MASSLDLVNEAGAVPWPVVAIVCEKVAEGSGGGCRQAGVDCNLWC